MHIREDEEQAVHTILVDAYYRLKQNQQKYFEKEREIGRDLRSATTCEEYRNAEALEEENRIDEGKRGNAILEGAIFRAYQELGEEDFKKVDHYVYDTSGGGYGWTYPGPPEPPAVRP